MEPIEIARQLLLVLSPLAAQSAPANLGEATTDYQSIVEIPQTF